MSNLPHHSGVQPILERLHKRRWYPSARNCCPVNTTATVSTTIGAASVGYIRKDCGDTMSVERYLGQHVNICAGVHYQVPDIRLDTYVGGHIWQ